MTLIASAPTSFFNRYETSEFTRKYNNNSTLKLKDTCNIIKSIFEETNPLLCGENALTLIEYIKQNKSKFNGDTALFSEDLIQLCESTDITLNSSPLIINETISQTALSEAAPSSNNNNNISTGTSSLNINNTVLVETLRSNINSDLHNQIQLFMLSSLPKSAKDEHYQELEDLLTKKTPTTNALTINKSYHDNKVY